MVTFISGEIDDDITDVVALRRCTECGREAAIYANAAPPSLENLLCTPTYWKECIVYGHPDVPAWHFCPVVGFFDVTGSFRIQILRH